ncbi:Hypothetical predicted protein [Lecanosticta acicola]|uniref:ubiquitinyl hydrolase 1 n=1 Tax=Lecanosticta acicola TaxID=111012 RepID=A0AAI8W259_9PEZI|nr:Hypothetical predicted protein [Lecanosticta acicola]
MMNQRQPVATASPYHHHHRLDPYAAAAAAHHHHHLHHLHHHHHHSPQSAAAAHLSPAAFHPPTTHSLSHYHDPALASLAYRPLHLPPQQQTLPQPNQRQQQQQQQQQHAPTASEATQQAPLSLAQLSAGPYHHQQQQQQHPHPSFHQHHSASLSQPSRAAARQQQTQQPAHLQHPQHQQQSAMADYAGDDQLAELQKLSDKYEPEPTGPLVGQRQPSTAITTEYASADPVYQAKTAALPQKYSHYRTVRGDGKCGWRAVGFGYFESLIRHGDSNTFAIEEARLRSLGNVIQSAGVDPILIEDFAEETFNLLRELSNALATGDADDILVERFNDDMLQNYLITHLRTLTSAWMTTHEENYAPWLLGQTVEQYCKTQITPVAAEMDNVGLAALKDVLLSPASITLEVLYLDRSEGREVTMHRFDPVNSEGQTIGSLRLLYRPGHYDLLYKEEDLPAPPPPQPAVPTYLQYASQSYEPVYDLGVSDFMTSIPGMSYANIPQGSWMSSTYGTGSDFFTTQAPVQSCAQTVPTPSAPAPQPHVQSQPVYASASTPTPMVAPPSHMPHELAIRTSVPQAAPGTSDLHSSGGPFRPSAWQLEPDFVSATSQMPFQTSIFRNSHFNTAHFLNPDFQPEQWDPDDEYATTSSSGKSSTRHKNSG